MLDVALVTTLKRAAEELFRPLPVLAAYAFGSRVSGTPHARSDLDIGYYLDAYRRGDGLSVREEMRLAVRFSDILGITVDLRSLAGAPLELRGRVLEEGVRIYSGEPTARVGLERELLGRYHDYKEIFQQMHERRLRAIAERGL